MVGYLAKTLEEALEIRATKDVVPYGGGTDLMIDGDEDISYLYLHQIKEMKKVVDDGEFIRIGASCTFTELIEIQLTPRILYDALIEIAAPAIRNFGTIGGNIGNGSAKADSVLIFFSTDSKIRVKSVRGERIVDIKDFYRGNKDLDLAEDEIIVEVLMPKKNLEGNYYYEKIGARAALAISRIDFSGIINIVDGKIVHLATAIGAVEPVIIRHREIDELLIGKTIEEAKELKEEYLNRYDKAINPTRGRVSAEYRKEVSLNLLRDFLEVNGI